MLDRTKKKVLDRKCKKKKKKKKNQSLNKTKKGERVAIERVKITLA